MDKRMERAYLNFTAGYVNFVFGYGKPCLLPAYSYGNVHGVMRVNSGVIRGG